MNAMFAEAAVIMAIGMATVFTFLLVLTGCVTVLTHFFSPLEDQTIHTQNTAVSSQEKTPTLNEMAAISSAVNRYRKSRSSF